ncbi:hypothetical protein [Haloferula sp.]|uniref:hypothetical protein n=1 Tax=Haloferula sp. TaxID=2497595 RepID=UPI003C7627E4
MSSWSGPLSFRKRWLSGLFLGAVVLSNCRQEETDDSALSIDAEPPRRIIHTAPPSDQSATRQSETLPASLAEFEEVVFDLPDSEILELLDMIDEIEAPETRQEMSGIVYEETTLRPPIVRLPLLLELARSEHVEPSLKATIMAELGTILNTDHGQSWADWSLALEEYLANKEGLIRVDAAE